MSGKIEAVVYTPDHVVVPDKNGKPNLHRIYRDSTGKQVISPNPNPVATARWELYQERFRGTGTINAPVMSARTGAMSAGTVTATIIDDKGKRQVMGEVIEKARIGGKALGKGAATVGRAAASRTPYGMAFMLALEALVDSGFFWDDEKGDFVRRPQNDTYTVMRVDFDKRRYTYRQGMRWTQEDYQEYCASDCQKITTVKASSFDKAVEVMNEYCKTQTYTSYRDNKKYYYDSFSIGTNQCHDSRSGMSGDFEVFAVILDFDLVPITLDEFIEEATSEAASKPDDWVKASEVKPTDEPKVEVPAGSVAQSDPYTDPKDRKVKQTRWDFDPNGRVRETEIPRPDLTPDSPEAPELKPPVEETPKDKDSDKDKNGDSETDKDKQPSDTESLCEKHPEILACQQMGEVKEEDGFFDDIEIPQVTDDTTWEEDRFLPSNGTCPAPKTFHVWGKPVQLSYEPLCRFMEMVRFIILVAFILMSAFLVFGSLRKE